MAKELKSTVPSNRLLSPRFKYTPAARTDVAETFRRVRARLEEERRDAEEREQKVRRLKP